ncbi:MAG: NifB/NifX family molybdenum-iron cluster-binding protein [Bacteroidota bacterium]
MKISFPTNDRKTIAKRTGRCEEFAIFELENSKIKNVEYLKNMHDHHDHHHGQGHGHGHHDHGDGHGHGHHDHGKGEGEHSHEEIGELLKDVDVLVVSAVGKFMRKALEDFGIKHQRSKNPNIEEVVNEFLEGID